MLYCNNCNGYMLVFAMHLDCGFHATHLPSHVCCQPCLHACVLLQWCSVVHSKLAKLVCRVFLINGVFILALAWCIVLDVPKWDMHCSTTSCIDGLSCLPWDSWQDTIFHSWTSLTSWHFPWQHISILHNTTPSFQLRTVTEMPIYPTRCFTTWQNVDMRL